MPYRVYPQVAGHPIHQNSDPIRRPLAENSSLELSLHHCRYRFHASDLHPLYPSLAKQQLHVAVVVLDASRAPERSDASDGAVAGVVGAVVGVVGAVVGVVGAVAVVVVGAVAVVVVGVSVDEVVVLGGIAELAAAGVHVVAVDSIRLRRLGPSSEDQVDICYSKHSLLSSSNYNLPR